MDKLFCEVANGRLECWTYLNGKRYYACYRPLGYIHEVEAYAKKNNYKLITVD